MHVSAVVEVGNDCEQSMGKIREFGRQLPSSPPCRQGNPHAPCPSLPPTLAACGLGAASSVPVALAPVSLLCMKPTCCVRCCCPPPPPPPPAPPPPPRRDGHAGPPGDPHFQGAAPGGPRPVRRVQHLQRPGAGAEARRSPPISEGSTVGCATAQAAAALVSPAAVPRGCLRIPAVSCTFAGCCALAKSVLLHPFPDYLPGDAHKQGFGEGHAQGARQDPLPRPVQPGESCLWGGSAEPLQAVPAVGPPFAADWCTDPAVEDHLAPRTAPTGSRPFSARRS